MDKDNPPDWLNDLHAHFLTSLSFIDNENSCYHKGLRITLSLSKKNKSKAKYISISPIFEEIYGGEHDGKSGWCRFVLDISHLTKNPDFKLYRFAIASENDKCGPRSFLKFKWKNIRIYAEINLEPNKDQPYVFDSFTETLMPKKNDFDKAN